MAQDAFAFEEEPARPAPWQLVVDLDGFEGPIDVLLTLARDQKVDLTRISILDLADQYLAFVEQVSRSNLEVAAEYLVMAAWLAYLKSRLLLPDPQPPDEASGEELAAALTFQLQRLEAMQRAGRQLTSRPRLGRDVLARGAPEGVGVRTRAVFDLTLYDLLKAYGDQRRRNTVSILEIEPPRLYSVDEAMVRLQDMLGRLPDWSDLSRYLPPGLRDPLLRRSAVTATLVASLELVRQGRLTLRQDGGAFSPIYLKAVRE